MKKIEAKFIMKNGDDYHFSNWAAHIKNKTIIRTTSFGTIIQEINKLEINTNYWVVIVLDQSPTAKHHVYDCKINSLTALLSRIAPNDFYIVDKKYTWLTYFNIDKENNRINVFKGGNETTPFENN